MMPSLSGLDRGDIASIVARADSPLRGLSGARILLTGATGWFGTWLLDALVSANRSLELKLSIAAISRHPQRFSARHPKLYAAPEIDWFETDVRAWPWPALPGVTHVIHAATEASEKLTLDDPGQMFETIVQGTRNALLTVEPTQCQAFLFISSGAIYGLQPASMIAIPEAYEAELSVDTASNAYARGKRVAEQLCMSAHQETGLPVKIARCFAFVGPHMPLDAHFAIGNFIGDAFAGHPIAVRSDGSPRRSYLYMTDLVVWLLAILVEGSAGRPYNVGSSHSVSIAQVARQVADARGLAVQLGPSRSGHDRDYVPDVSRITGELAVSEGITLDEAIRKTLAWCAATRQ